jgi:hypothetical protein
VAGVAFETTETTEFTIDADEDVQVPRDEFFTRVALGDLVKVKDRDNDGIAEEIELRES